MQTQATSKDPHLPQGPRPPHQESDAISNNLSPCDRSKLGLMRTCAFYHVYLKERIPLTRPRASRSVARSLYGFTLHRQPSWILLQLPQGLPTTSAK